LVPIDLPRQKFPSLQCRFGGRAGAGQLDWAAAEIRRIR
jgi:hypothetical protein